MAEITQEKAIDIADKHIKNKKKKYLVYDHLPENCRIYGMPEEKCWFILLPFDSRGVRGLDSSRLIIISRTTGKVLFDGSANDEG